jgi:hypothetical protein
VGIIPTEIYAGCFFHVFYSGFYIDNHVNVSSVAVVYQQNVLVVLGGMLGQCSRSATTCWMHMGWNLFDLYQWSAVVSGFSEFVLVACWADALDQQPSVECTWVGSFLISINGVQFVAGFCEFVMGHMLGGCSRSATIYWMHMGWKLFYLHQQSSLLQNSVQQVLQPQVP